jgi:hypothetical protein
VSGVQQVAPRARTLLHERTGVPWSTVLPLAAAMAFADDFWVVTLRGSVGAVERTPAPFKGWLLESALVLPLFVLAVLAAVTLALRRFGPVLRRRRTVLLTLLLVVAAGTLVGITLLAVSSAIDYHLQSGQVAMQGAMRDMCSTAGCQDHQLAVTRGLQYKSVGFGSALLLVSNVVVVAWAVALRGGRVEVGSRGQAGAGSRERDLRLVLAAGLVAGGLVHAAVVPEHFAEWPAAGVFFVLLTAAQLAVAGLLFARPGRLAAGAAAAVSAGPLVLWRWSRTLGMPIGPEPNVPEAIGVIDVVASVLEVATLVLAVLLLRAFGSVRRPRASSHAVALACVAILGVTAIGLASSDLPWFDGLLGGAGQSMTMTP